MKDLAIGILIVLVLCTASVFIEKQGYTRASREYSIQVQQLEAETALQRLEIDSLRTELKIREVHKLGR